MIIDTHAHLNMEPLIGKTNQLVDEAKLAGIEGIVIPSVDISTSKIAKKMAVADPMMVAGVGIHPETIQEHGKTELLEIEHLINSAVGAIGEIGLDYFRLPEGKEAAVIQDQRDAFRFQLELAKKYYLPSLIHTRTPEAINDAIEDITVTFSDVPFKGVFHCFTGTIDQFRLIENLEVFVGVNGIITFPNSIELQATISQIPLDRIVLETDAPLLAPQPFRGKINTPANVTIVALKLAEIYGVSVSTVIEKTGNNALRLFPQIKELL